MSEAENDDLEENELIEEGSFEAPPGEDELEVGLALDPEDLGDFDDGDEEDDDEEDGEEGGEDGDASPTDPSVDVAAAPTKSKAKLKDEEEEEPGPDVPPPTLKKMREALAWAFEKEDIEGSILDRFAEHARMMLDKNRTVFLTPIIDPREVAAKHYLDSWRITQMMSLMGKTVLDLGTGSGFPGLPLAMSEAHCKVILIDSREKKSEFNKHCIEKLKIKNAEAHWGRGEEFLEGKRIDAVLIRNVSSVRENVRTLRKVRHSLKDLMMLKGASWSREVRAGEREAERLGFTLDTVWEHELPDEMGKRAILVYRAPGAM